MACSGARALSLLYLLAEVGDDWHGQMGLAGQVSGPGRLFSLSLRLSLSLSSNYFWLLFSIFVLALLKMPEHY